MAYDPESHSFALNCAEDAFRTAIHTLESRRATFGSSSPAFRAWLVAQDEVFANCEEKTPSIPAEASSNLPAIVRADRDYQIAAAYFYAGNYTAALERFRRIGQDAASPWNEIARYLVVRTLLRMSDDARTATATGAQLKPEAERILADPRLVGIHGMTWNILQRKGIRDRDPHDFLRLAQILSRRGQDNGFRETLWNYTTLYDHVIGESDPNRIYRSSKAPAVNAADFRDADLSDWIFCFQARDSSVLLHSILKWKQSRSEAWLLAALEHASPEIAAREGLLAAAEALTDRSPAYLTARFHLLRMYGENGNRPAARDALDTLLAGPLLQGLPSSENLFRGLRMRVAPDFQEFLRFAARRPVLITLDMDIAEAPNLLARLEVSKSTAIHASFDRDATRVLNRETPFRLLKEAAVGGTLPTELRREALLTAFARGLMLDEDLTEIARQLALEPQLAPLAHGYLDEDSAIGRRFAAAFLLLHRPEARPYFASGVSRQTRPGRIDNYRDNWWCPVDIEIELDSRANLDLWRDRTPDLAQRSVSDVLPEFLTGDAVEEVRRENKRLAGRGAATDFLAGVVFDYEKAHGRDPRIPEALHYVVRSGHFGCADVNTWKVTRSAFRLLHLRYPHSEWAKRTPTWFQNDFDIRREIQSARQ